MTPSRSRGKRVLIIGSGFLATDLKRTLEEQGYLVTCASRRPRRPGPTALRLDATDEQALAALATHVTPDHLLLVHGPSDITWCEETGAEALRVHRTIASNVAHLAERGPLTRCRVVLISTDNVFPGTAESYGETDTVAPVNRYGIAKVAAEEELLRALPPEALLIIRVSLVYGWQDPRVTGWLNFFMAALANFTTRQRFEVPAHLWNTPIRVEDFTAVTALLIAARQQGIFHCAGPDRLSRVEWAATLARIFKEDGSLISAVDKQATRYGCRPQNACLHSTRLARIPGYDAIRPLGVEAAAHALRRHPPSWVQDWLREQSHRETNGNPATELNTEKLTDAA